MITNHRLGMDKTQIMFKMFLQIILVSCITAISSLDLTVPGQAVPHANLLREVLTSAKVMNLTDTPEGSLFEFLTKGTTNKNNTENLDINVLDVENVRKIVERTKKKYYEKEMSIQARRTEKEAMNTKNHRFHTMSLRQMEQSIFSTRYRLQDTKFWRNHFKADVSYQIAVLCGSMHQIIMKMDNLYAQMHHFPQKTHFLWFLIIYEKILAGNVDVTYIVKKMHILDKEFKDSLNKREAT